jgi:hypothetical protein
MDGTQFGEDLAAMKVAASPTVLRNMYFDALYELQRCHCYRELEQVLDELGKMDPYETLCTPSSIIWELREDDVAPGGSPWLYFFSEPWSKTTHSSYAQFAVALGYTSHGEVLARDFAFLRNPTWEEGCLFYEVGAQLAAKVEEKSPAGPSCQALAKTKAGSGLSEAALSGISRKPDEIALHLMLQSQFKGANRPQKAKILKALANSPSNYALFYAVQLPYNHARKTALDGWEWDILDRGFQALLKDHPNALGLRNAYAVAAACFEKREIQRDQLAQLGYLVDLAYWDGLEQYQNALGELPDYRLNQSKLAPLALSPSLQKIRISGLPQLQANDLFEKEFWSALDADLASLPAEQLEDVEVELQRPRTESEAVYRKRETRLKAWREARPNSLAATANLGGFYVNYGWLARGTGSIDSVSLEDQKIFHQRLKSARDLLFQAYGANYQSAETMACLMVIYNAETDNLNSAQKLAIQAAQKGPEKYSALKKYAEMLLPRWQGNPGDLPKACDVLREKVGNDDAYCIMMDSALDNEGWLGVVDQDSPTHMDWKRAVDSLIEGERAGRLPGILAYYYLTYADAAGWRTDAARILPYVPTHVSWIENELPTEFIAHRRWAEGKAEGTHFQPTISYRSMSPHRQKTGPVLNLGFELRLNRAFPNGKHYVVDVECPLAQPDGGRPYIHYQLTAEIDPLTQTKLPILAWPAPGGGYPPGTYKVSLLDPGSKGSEVLHSETFEVTP